MSRGGSRSSDGEGAASPGTGHRSDQRGQACLLRVAVGQRPRRSGDHADMARRSGIRAAVGLQARMAPVVDYVRTLVRDGYVGEVLRSEEHTSELQSLMRISYAVFCLKKK